MATSGPPRPERQQPQKGNPPPTKYYFAYGSNLCLNQMKKRCPNSRYIGTARLSNHLWHINERGYANVKAAEGHWVEGLVYEIDEADEASLDTYEGVSKNAYHKCLTRVLLQKAPGALYRRPVAWIVNQGGPAEVSRKTESADKAAPRPDVPPQVAANTLTYINLALTGESHPKKEYVKRMNLGISDAVALGIGEDYVRSYMRPFIPKSALLNPRESEPGNLKKKKSASPARGRNAATTASQSRESSSTGKSRALSLPPERKREGRSVSRGRCKESSNGIKAPVQSDGPPPLPSGPPPLPPGPPPSTLYPPTIVVEGAPRQSNWKWWPFSS